MRRIVEDEANATEEAIGSKVAGEASPLVSGSDMVTSRDRAHGGPPGRVVVFEAVRSQSRVSSVNSSGLGLYRPLRRCRVIIEV